MSSDVSSVERFKSNMVILIDIIEEMFTEGYENKVISTEFKLLSILKIIIQKVAGEKMLRNFIERTHHHWNMIQEKDIEYFKNLGMELFSIVKDKGLDSYKDDDNAFFKGLSDNHIDLFKELLEGEYVVDGETVKILDDERRDDIWKILHSFIRISIVYIHQSRRHDGKSYTVEFFPQIKVRENVEKWGIKSIKL